MHRTASAMCLGVMIATGCAGPAPATATIDPAILVGQLDDPQLRIAAANALVAQGSAAVAPLLAELERAIEGQRPSRQREVLRLLRALGPAGGDALPGLLVVGPRLDMDAGHELVRTVAELAPHRPPGLVIHEDAVGHSWHRGASETTLELRRLRVRAWSETGSDLSTLLAMANEADAFRIELAIEKLARLGRAARTALPALAAVLDRPDPRVTESTRRVPLRASAAKAIVRIDPDSTLAIRARAVLAGTEPDRGDAPVPERTQRRIDALVAAFATAAERDLAAQHLVALGIDGIRVLLREVTAHRSDPTVSAQSARVADAPGPALAGCLPELVDLVPTLRPADRSRVIDALAAAAPHARDVLVLECGLRVRDQIVQAEIVAANDRLQAVLDVPSWLSDDALVAHLNGWPPRVDRALRLLETRGAAARPTLPALAAALRRIPKSAFQFRPSFIRARIASAILAIADKDDPLVAEASKILNADPNR